MDELKADLVERDARRERFRYRMAAIVVFGAPLLAATITASIATIVQTRFLSHDEVCVTIALGNAVLAAIGSGCGVWIEPGSRRNSKIAGLLGGCVFGFLLYFGLAAVTLYLVNLVFH